MTANADQIEYWNARAGEKWAALQPALDAMLVSATELLLTAAGAEPGMEVLDIGCGTGETCARLIAQGAAVTGVDVSAPMLAVARERTGDRATLIEADASVWRSPRPFALAVSRFGVMFFDDPARAFANIRANLREGGRLVFACWQSPAENPWAMAPMAAIRDLLPEPPTADPHAPGPFALADADRTAAILDQAGFANVEVAGHRLSVTLAASGGAEAAARFALQIGPAAAALAEAGRDLIEPARERLTAMFALHEVEGVVRMNAAIWIVTATA